MLGTVIDIAIGTLLIVAIGFGVVIDRRVRALMEALGELKPAVDDFSIAVDRSEGTVVALRAGLGGGGAAAAAEPKAKPEPKRLKGLASLRPQRPETRRRVESPAGVAQVDDKSDLVRSFFETARSNRA
jgi:hypothetical protein